MSRKQITGNLVDVIVTDFNKSIGQYAVATDNPSRLMKLVSERMSNQNITLSTVDSGSEDILFGTVDQFSRRAPVCDVLYAPGSTTQIQLRLMTSFMHKEPNVVFYE
jgi:hypothetical protein